MTIYGRSEELVSRCVECDLAEPESLTSLGGSAPGVVDGILSLPEYVPSPADEAPNAPQFFSNWEHSGNCYQSLEGGRRNKACLSFNSEVKPTIEQLFEMFFSRISSWKLSPPNKSQPTT